MRTATDRAMKADRKNRHWFFCFFFLGTAGMMKFLFKKLRKNEKKVFKGHTISEKLKVVRMG
jgi:hypothetical protein